MDRAIFQKPSLSAGFHAAEEDWLGVHFNSEGKIALYGKESPGYDYFTSQGEEAIKLLPAMRNKRASKGGD